MPSAVAEAKAAAMDNAVDVWRLTTASRLDASQRTPGAQHRETKIPGSGAGGEQASGKPEPNRKIAGTTGYICHQRRTRQRWHQTARARLASRKAGASPPCRPWWCLNGEMKCFTEYF